MALTDSTDKGNTARDDHESPTPTVPVLALYPNLRQSGWAVFGARSHDGTPVLLLAASGTVGPGLRTRMDPRQRIGHQLEGLTAVAVHWRPRSLAISWPGGMDWGAGGMRQLEEHLRQWAESQGLRVVDYQALHVRAAIAGKPNASKEALAYSVMACLDLVGEYRSALEWEAIAAGYYHLALREQEG